MAGWFARLMGRAPPAPGPVAVPGPAAPAAAAASAAAQAPTFGVRRPLVGSKGGVAGFELLLPPALERRLAQRSDTASLQARAANQALLLASAAPLCRTGRLVLVTMQASTLARPGVAQQAVSGALICVPDLAQLPGDTAAQLRARGVRLGVPNGPPQDAPVADFVWLPAETGGLDTLLLAAQRWREQRAPLPLLATGLQHLDDVERVLRAGFTLVGGALDRGQGVAASRPLSAAAHRICELLNHLAMDQDTGLIAEAVRSDVALSYRLLRYANSPALGLRNRVESVDAAVMLLGRQELQRWLNVLLLSVADSRQATRAVQEMALARGRLLEGLARLRGHPAPQTLFTMGLLSLLEVLLQTPLAAALAPLRLPEPVVQALLHRQGPLADYLVLAEAMDAGLGASTEQSAERFGGLEAVQELADGAWAWAAEVAVSSAPERPAAGVAGDATTATMAAASAH
jgi:c-di-GMP phosphodiesterase